METCGAGLLWTHQPPRNLTRRINLTARCSVQPTLRNSTSSQGVCWAIPEAKSLWRRFVTRQPSIPVGIKRTVASFHRVERFWKRRRRKQDWQWGSQIVSCKFRIERHNSAPIQRRYQSVQVDWVITFIPFSLPSSSTQLPCATISSMKNFSLPHCVSVSYIFSSFYSVIMLLTWFIWLFCFLRRKLHQLWWYIT